MGPYPISLSDVPGAPAAGTLLCRRDDLCNNRCVELKYSDGDHLFMGFICMQGDNIRAFENKCPHNGSPLNLVEEQFYSNDGSELQCRTHNARFNPKNGRCTQGPCIDQWLRQITIVVDGDNILAG